MAFMNLRCNSLLTAKGFYKTNKYFHTKECVGTEEGVDRSQSELEREGERAAKEMTVSLFS
jgi:hypothetical protein